MELEKAEVISRKPQSQEYVMGARITGEVDCGSWEHSMRSDPPRARAKKEMTAIARDTA